MRLMRIITRTLTAVALLAATSCGSAVRTGSAPMFLVLSSLAGNRGGPSPGQPASPLISDVLTLVTTGANCTTTNPCPFVFGDNGTATMQLAKKDVASVAAPTSNNEVTISRVHVHYRRSDGGGVPGVDVPADFDTFATATVPTSGTVQIGFELVRVQAKQTTPLFPLRASASGGVLGVVAEVTFYGQDRVGNSVMATGSIQIEFADWAD
jgi:hypothetical protein